MTLSLTAHEYVFARCNPIHQSLLSPRFLVQFGDKLQSHFTTEGVHHFLLGFAGDLLDCLPFGSHQNGLQPIKTLILLPRRDHVQP